MTLLAILAVWTLTSIPLAFLISRCIPRDPRHQATRESEPTGFLGVGGAADQFVSHTGDNA